MDRGRDADTSQDFTDFLQHICRDVKVIDGLLIGSTAELPLEYVFAKLEDFAVDEFQFSSRECAVWRGETSPALPRNFTGTVFVVEPVYGRPGYARLRKPDGKAGLWRNPRYLSFDEMATGHTCRKSGYRRTEKRTEKLIDFLGVLGALKEKGASAQTFLGLDGITLNIQGAITCLSWPPEAAEWIDRKRQYGWPAQDLLENVVEGGCHLEPDRSTPTPNDDTVFRVSFARAEVALIYTWSPVQKYIYHVLRLIKGDVVRQLELHGLRNVVCTYHFKTMMLWACETKPPEFWDESRVKSSVGELLCQMIEFLVDRRCPNYFLPNVNLMGHLSESLDMNAVIMPLLVFKEQGAARLIATVPMADPENKSTIQLSKRLINLGQFGLSSVVTHAGHRRSTGRFCGDSPKKNFADPAEFTNLHNGVTAHLRLASNSHNNGDFNAVRSSLNDYEMAMLCLEQAVLADNRSFTRRQVSFGDALPEVFSSILFTDDRNHEVCSLRSDVMSSETSDMRRSPSPKSLSEQSKHQDSETANDRAEKVVLAKASPVAPEPSKGSGVDKFEERAGAEKKAAHSSLQFSLSLAINVIVPAFDLMFPKSSFFVSAAYRANFLYAYCHDYQLALLVCDESLMRIRATKLNLAATYIHDVCSVVLAPKWMPLFDRHIQAVYGFVALAQSLNGKGRNQSSTERVADGRSTSPNDFLPSAPAHYVSTIEFIEYIKMQCEDKLLSYRVNSGFGTGHRRFSYWFSCAQRSLFILQAALRISAVSPCHSSYGMPTWNPYATGHQWKH